MNDRFFDLSTPRDMLNKAVREHFSRLETDLSIDNVFNFFVTAFLYLRLCKKIGVSF